MLATLLVTLSLSVSAAPLYHEPHTRPAQDPIQAPAQAPRFHTTRPSDVRLPLPEEDDAFTFAVFGDRTGGPPEGVAILAEAVEEVNLFDPDLVMTVGDLIQGYGEAPAWLREMREYRAIMGELDCPWFPVAGNHDVYWRGEGERPEGEHEGLYEMHFGPLWYAFEHKDSWFIVLYTDEGTAASGEKTFRDPEAQRMSPEQLAWLESALKRAKGANHVFVFLHHPRWIGGHYGDDWERVHELLAKAGNVTAAFAGHIHHMRYDPRDGIEYYSLATVGGGQSGAVPEAGYLHQYHLVTVRPEEVRVAAFPVGSAFDPKRITGVVAEETRRLAHEFAPAIAGSVALQPDLSARGRVQATLTNPLSRPIDIQLTTTSSDPLWRAQPEHVHERIEAGAQTTIELQVRRRAGGRDWLSAPELELRADYLAEEERFPVPARTHSVPVDLAALPQPEPREAASFDMDGTAGHLSIANDDLYLPDGPFTLECWFNAREFRARQGLVTKTESSEFGLFVGDARPAFWVHVGGSYAVAQTEEQVIQRDRWYHLAGVFDGSELRLYLDGQLYAAADASGTRQRNTLPLIVGADVGSGGNTNSHFPGRIDEVRLSTSARYDVAFDPLRRVEADAQTSLLLHLDGSLGPWTLDASEHAAHATIAGGAQFVQGR